MTDPWTRFEAAFSGGEPTSELMRSVISETEAAPTGTSAERQGLVACATSWLAFLGEDSLEVALAETERAWSLGELAWPSLYLGYAALSRGNYPLALQSLSQIPDGYFDAIDLHWRSVEVMSMKAEAFVRLEQSDEAYALAVALNAELRNEGDDDLLPTPWGLVSVLLEPDRELEPLIALVHDLDLSTWFGDRADDIRRRLTGHVSA